MCSHPPLRVLHSSMPHLPTGSSCESGQSIFESQTFEFGMHMPPPQSNSVFASHFRIGIAVYTHKITMIIGSKTNFSTNWNLLQLNSSLPSAHSAFPEHIKWPGIQVRSLHWNWSGRQVTFWQCGGFSSSPCGQSTPPSQSQLLWMHVMRSLHWYSVCKHSETARTVLLQPWKLEWKEMF